MSAIEQEEKARLDACLQSIDNNLQSIGTRLNAYAQEIQTNKDYLWEARRDMDHIEKIAVRETIDQKMRSGEVLQEQQQKLKKLKKSPYFGRFDFARDDA
ncbi:hypothetical protein [Fodinicurvata fenggangensis]|uniref:hypothetical protein n=1 Tax=Fodinicurvata fenggangensis TaxID=1121830 RepID=UPI000AA330F6|nr:hypothetical protein [Fodinicurvata fenggangensis]